MGIRRYARPLANSVRKVFPTGYFLALYGNASKRISAPGGERDRAFADFLRRSEGKHCLQISVKDEIGHEFRIQLGFGRQVRRSLFHRPP